MVPTLYDGHDDLYHHAKFGEGRTLRAGCRCENVLFVTGRLPCIKFTHCVSGHKSAFSPLQEKLCVGSNNDYFF